jgi:hypothetical protein
MNIYNIINMNTSTWGPHAWVFLHSVSFNYPKNPTYEHKKYHKNYFTSLGGVLPCKHCRDSYQVFLKDIPIDDYLDTRAGLIYWVYQIHDKVNKKLDKESIPFKTMVRNYELMRTKCQDGQYDRQNQNNFGKCLNPVTNQINEDELDKFVLETLNKYEYKSTELHSYNLNIINHIAYNNLYWYIILLLFTIIVIFRIKKSYIKFL